MNLKTGIAVIDIEIKSLLLLKKNYQKVLMMLLNFCIKQMEKLSFQGLVKVDT